MFFPLGVCSRILSYSYLKQIYRVVQVAAAVFTGALEQTSTGVSQFLTGVKVESELPWLSEHLRKHACQV